jgi:hypothetical protein
MRNYQVVGGDREVQTRTFGISLVQTQRFPHQFPTTVPL